MRVHENAESKLGLTPPGSAPLSMSFEFAKEGQNLVLGQKIDKLPLIG